MSNNVKKLLFIFKYTLMLTIALILFGVDNYSVNAATVGDTTDFPYTGDIQTFTAPATGYYKLEVWGAQGGSSGGIGGYGAYSYGTIELKKGQTVYVVVGGAGSAYGNRGSNESVWAWGYGGFNGGGSGYAACGQGGGGGATHIATTSGVLSSLSNDTDSILIVASGGGGAYHWKNGNGNGNHGGGYTTSAAKNTYATGSFGQGGNGRGAACGGGAGGGGYLGGNGGGNVGYGGGGSSYVANSLLTNKATYCYNCATSTAESTKTVSITCVSATATANCAKSSNGYAKITIQSLSDTEARFSSLSVTGGIFNEPFDPDNFIYNVIVDSDNSNVDITGTLMSSGAVNVGLGNYKIHAGLNTITLVNTADSGDVLIYTINITRMPSSYQYLNDIMIDGVSIEGFSPTTLTYNINVGYDTDILNLDVIKGRTDQELYLPSDFSLKSGLNTFQITVVSEDGNYTTTYTLNINRNHSSKLKSIEVDGYELDPIFDSDTFTYNLYVLSSVMTLNVKAVAYDDEAVITYDGFGYIKSNKTATITVTEPNSEPTIYEINIDKNSDIVVPYEFSYTGSIQEFVVPYSGYYLIETWGAQGGSSGGIGGYGAYSSGATYLNRDDILYIAVGGAGSAYGDRGSNESVWAWGYGGYNGGGSGYAACGQGGGGGATHIATTSGVLSSLSNDTDSILIVASGGGGAYHWKNGNGNGNHGGGYTTSAAKNAYATGSFGQGGTGRGAACGGGAGGGGYLGGNGGGNVGYGGGGSSYIASSNLISYKEYTKVMYCYNCSTSNVESTYTVSTTNVSSTPTSYYAKSGNGYARITLLPQPSENNFLSSITVKTRDYETDIEEVKDYTPEYDMETEDYYLTVGVSETTAILQARPEDSTATIVGLGEVEVLAGENIYEITVTAESGAVKIYRIHITREASTNEYPVDITISGLVPSLCSTNESFCNVEPANFDKDTNTYYLTVPSRIKQLWFNVEKGHPYQTVTGEGKVSLDGGENIITIEVESEDGSKTSVYKYYVTRDMTGNTDLSRLEVVDPEREINYDPDITEYYISVPNDYTEIKELIVETDDPNASYIISGNENFETGMNQVNILVTAANGETKTYIINVYREKSGNTYLSNIEVKNGDTVYPLIPEFNKINLGTYKTTVPNDISEVEIVATPEVETTKVTGIGNVTLKTGTNDFIITTTAEDGSIELYTVTITREKNSNANLIDITITSDINTYTLTPEFDKEILDYTLEVEEGIESISITATPEVSTTSYKLLDNTTIKVGDNVKRVMAIAEDGTSKIYTITITRPANTNNYLSSLNVKTGDSEFVLTPEFNKEILEYTLEVENEVTSVTIVGEKENYLSVVIGNGTYYLAVGENELSVSVTAEDGNTRTYQVKIIRKANSNAYLKLITTSEGILVPEFDKETKEYIINVENTVDSISISAKPEVSTTTVTGIGKYNLNSGSNIITLTTLAEDGITTLTYEIDVIKDKSDNDNLSYLLMEEGILSPKFDPNIISYQVTVPNEVTQGTFHVELEDSKATYEIIGNENFEVGENEVIVRVTSESGLTKDYKVVVNRQEKEVSSNYLSNLEVDKGTLVPSFNKENLYYEVELEYEEDNITVSATKEDANAYLVGVGTYQLEVGKNIIGISVEGVDGKARDYQVVVTRKKNTEARLSSLIISATELNPTFDKDIYEYSLTTAENELTFTKIETVDKNATYEIIGNSFTTTGDYEVTIRVTAQDGVTTKDYTLYVSKSSSNNNNLSSLEVVGYEISPSFNKTTTLYTLTVEDSVNNIVIEAKAEDENAKITGIGIEYLTVGDNYFVVEVESESGKVKSYTIIVTKEGSSNNNISSLIVNNGTMTPAFNTDTMTYDVEVPYEEESLDLTVILEDANASYTIVNNTLQVGNNTVSIVVTAEDGSVKTYTLNVERSEIVSALLEDLKVKNYEITPVFNRYITEYDVIVDNEVTSLDLTIIPLDKNATYTVSGNENFEVGDNTVTIEVTASDGVTKENYILHVNRQKYSNTYLDYLYTSEGDVEPTFDKYTMEYSITVANEVEEIELFGEAVDKSATVEGLGVHSLTTGENKLAVSVTTTSGVKRIYYVTVIREKASNNYLSSLTAKVGAVNYELTPEFNKTTLEYQVTVPVGTPSINISGEKENSTSTVEGFGVYSLKAGENEINIQVTSEAGEVRTYQVIVTREASSNNYLTELIPSVGNLEPEFSYEETSYTIHLDSSASLLSFSYATEYAFASVTGVEAEVVPDGTSTREIIVTAEDGTTRTYTITVNKERTDNALLSSLSVTGYEFEEEFDPNVFEYHITVPNSKKILTASEVIVAASDKNATITKSGSLTLVTTTDNTYIVKVTAPDGFTTQEYKIIVTREKSSEALLNSLVVNTGYLTKTFNPNVYEYTWMVPKGSILTKESVTATASNSEATILKTERLEVVSGEANTYEVKVISEDGVNTVSYILNIEIDLSSDASLGSLTIDKGYYLPTFDSNIYEYDVYEYVDTESIEVEAVPTTETSVVTSGNGTVTLDSETIVHTIIVTAEDGTIETYTLNIHKTILKDEGLKNLGLNGLEELECIHDKCKLSPEFATDIIEYAIKVPYEYTNLDIMAEPMNEQQIVKYKIGEEYIESYSLPLGATTVVVEVYDGMGEKTKEYTLVVERCKSNNTNLSSLEVSYDNGEKIVLDLSPSFDKNTLEYSVTVPNEIEEVLVEAVPEDSDARVTVNGYNYLQEGSNTVEVTVTASDGTIKTYLIDVVRESLYNSYLKNITVSTGTFWELSPKFKSTVFNYTTTITGSYERITLEAVPMVSTTTVTGTGEYDIVTGNNEFTITATAVDGSISIYKINVVKEISRNVNLTNLIVEEGNLSPTFETGITKYDVNVGEDVEKLTIHAVLEDPTSSYIVTGNEHLVMGENIVNVIVMSSDKSASKTYQLTVHKEASSNNYLSSIRVLDEENTYPLVPDFDKEELTYQVELTDTVEKVTIEAESENILANISGCGEEYLMYGNNQKLITVTAEDGSIRIYTINLYRNYNLNLKLLVSDIGEMVPEFDKDTLEYRITVPNEEEKIVFIAQSESDKVSVSGSGTYSLAYGENAISFIVEAPDLKTKEYKVIVERELSSNNYIESLVTHEGIMTPEFDKETLEYEVSVRNTVTEVGMDIILEDKNASYEVIGNENLQLGANEVIIRVTAQNGDIRDYQLNVILQDDSYFSNKLLDISITNGKINPDFDPEINYYAATVANSITSTEITVVKENVDAIVEGIGVKELKLGRNVFQIPVTSKDGIVNTYTLVVYREENSDATLSSLTVKNHNFLPIFNKQVENYTLEVESETSSLEIEAVPSDPNSKVEITGNESLVTGENIVTIKVTAPDLVTTKTYTLTVNKVISTNNYLSNLEVVGYSFSSAYDKTVPGPYIVNVENTVNSIIIEGQAEVATTTVTGLGKYELSTGQNVIKVQATSESGEVRIYTIIVNKSKNSDSSLKNIIVSDGSLAPVFNADTLEYEVKVDSDLESITVTGIVNSETSTVSRNGTYLLENKETEVILEVSAEDGSKTIYKVKVVKNVESSSKIINLVVKEGQLYPTFHKNTTNYTILVPNEVTSLQDMEITLEDENASYEVIGNSDFKVGSNTVTIRVTSEDTTTTTDYVLNVSRQIAASNYLKDLEVVGYSLTPVFDKNTLYYEVEVASDVEQVQIKATKEDTNATLSGTGYKTLNDTESRFYITVTSQSGAVRTYSVVVKKTLDNENLLLTLIPSVGSLTPTFDPYTNEYVLEVPEKTKTLTLEGTSSSNTTVVGLGTSEVKVGEQERTITVTSQSGETNIYQVTVIRKASTNTELESLTPSSGTLEYSNDILEYELRVEDNVSVISFEAIASDSDASISGLDLVALNYGENEITITVTAEDKVTTREIKITVIREKEISKIIPSEDNLILGVGETYQITYTLEPEDTSYPEVEWISNGENIVSVDENGEVTALEIGSTTVQIRSKHNPLILATINVNVISKEITSSTYEINREGEISYVIGSNPKTDLNSFIESFDNNPSTLHLYNEEDIEITGFEMYVGSYMKIKLIVNETVYDELEVVVRGDFNGDGLVTAADTVSVKNLILGKLEKTFINTKIADINNDGLVTAPDAVSVKNYILGRGVLN